MTITMAAGVDVGRDWLDVAMKSSASSFRAPNLPAGITAILRRLRRVGVTRVVLESNGALAARLARTLAGAGLAVGVGDPRRIAALRLAEGGRAKTDRLDAKFIARFALIMNDAIRPIPGADALELRALSTRRRTLVEMIAMKKTRLKQVIDLHIIASCSKMIRALGEERPHRGNDPDRHPRHPRGLRASP